MSISSVLHCSKLNLVPVRYKRDMFIMFVVYVYFGEYVASICHILRSEGKFQHIMSTLRADRGFYFANSLHNNAKVSHKNTLTRTNMRLCGLDYFVL